MIHTQAEIDWRKENDAFEQLKIVLKWADYEDYGCFDDIRTAEELIELFIFVNFDIGVEFVGGVYDLMEEEEEDEDTTTADLCKEFNNKLGRNYWRL